MRPFANFITLNEVVNLVIAYAIGLQSKWMAKDIYAMVKELEAFPISGNQTYVYRIMKDLAKKDILYMHSSWSTSQRPTLHYSVTDKGNVHFFTGEEAVIKRIPVKIQKVQHFLSDLAKNLNGTDDTPPPHVNQESNSIIGVADYYDWLLLRAGSDGLSPYSLKDMREEFGKPINMAYLYKLRGDLEKLGYLAGEWITPSGKVKLLQLEVALAQEVNLARDRIERLQQAETKISSWIRHNTRN